MKLNYRDKVILGIVLAIFIIIAGFIGLIKPQRQAVKDNKEKLEEVEDKKDEIDRRIATASGLEDSIHKFYKDADTLGKIFVPKSDIDQTTLLDKFMQEYANECEVKVIDLKVDDTAANSLAYYYKPYKEVASALRESADINGSLLDKINEESKEATTIEGRNVETIMSTRYGLEVIGEKRNVWKYMDTIDDIDSAVLITAIGFERYKEGDEDQQQQPAAGQNGNNANNQQGQNNNNNSEDRETIEDDTMLRSSIVIQLYSIYNMEEPITE